MSYASKPAIVWLDQCIDRHNQYQTLKDAFSKNLHPEWVPSPCLKYTNLYNLVKTNFNKESYSYKSNAIEVYVFHNEDICTHYLQKNKDKRIFLIISSVSFTNFLQRIIEDYADVVQHSLEDQRISIYTLCKNIVEMAKQLKDYQQYVQIFNSETNLLAQLTNAVGDYFFFLGRKQFNDKTYKSISQALKYFCWANILFERSNDYEKYMPLAARIRIVDEHITNAKQLLEQVRNDNDDIDQCIAYADTNILNDVEMTEFSLEDERAYRLTFNGSIIADNNVHLQESSSTMPSSCVEEESSEKAESSNIGIFLLKRSFSQEMFQNISTILIQLFAINLIIIQEERDYEQLLKQFDLSIIVLPLLTDEDRLPLEKLCALSQPPLIYLLGSQPTTINEKEIFFKKYHSICYISNNPEELAVQMAIDMAMKNRMVGDRYAGKKNKINAEKNYDQCIEILNRLDDFAEKNIDQRD